MRTIIDNWSLYVVSRFLRRIDDPGDRWRTISFDGNEPRLTRVSAGVLQLECLFRFLEQLVYSDQCLVQGGWTRYWEDGPTSLTDLGPHPGGIIEEVPPPEKAAVSEWLVPLLSMEGVSDPYVAGMSETVGGNVVGSGSDEAFWSQVIHGAASYLSLSHGLDTPYEAHPVNQQYIDATVGRRRHSSHSHQAMEELVAGLHLETRAALLGRSGQEVRVKVPSVVTLCLAEASSAVDPITVAAQLREEGEILELRNWLDELEAARRGECTPRELSGKIYQFERSAEEAMRRLGVRGRGGSTSTSLSVSLISLLGLSLPILQPRNSLGAPLSLSPPFLPKLARCISRLVDAATFSGRDLISSRLGIEDSIIIDEWFHWSESQKMQETGPHVISERTHSDGS